MAIAKAANELCRRSELHGACDLLRARIGPAILQVVPHRPMQKGGVLCHHADCAPEALLRDVADVLAVDRDAPSLRIEEAQQKIDERGLAGARAAHDPDLLTGRNSEIEAMDHTTPLAIVEGHIFEADIPRPHVQVGSSSLVYDPERL